MPQSSPGHPCYQTGSASTASPSMTIACEKGCDELPSKNNKRTNEELMPIHQPPVDVVQEQSSDEDEGWHAEAAKGFRPVGPRAMKNRRIWPMLTRAVGAAYEEECAGRATAGIHGADRCRTT